DPETDTHNCGSCGHDCAAPLDQGGLGQNGICVGGECVCAPGKGCAGGATCIGPEHTYTTAGTCCQTPEVGECCTDSAPGAADGFARCCTPGVDCFDGAACPNGGRHALGGAISGCCNPECVAGDATAYACVGNFEACSPTLPCCSELPCDAQGRCPCLPVGNTCGRGLPPGDLQCCGGQCLDGVCCADGNCGPCLPDGEPCTEDTDCCSAICAKNNTNEPQGVCSSCVAQLDDACALNRDCCNQLGKYLVCFAGACQCCNSSVAGECANGAPIPTGRCTWPQVAFACCAGDPNNIENTCHDCVSACCTPGVDCDPNNGQSPNNGFPCP